MPVQRADKKQTSFLVGGIPREYLVAAREAAQDHGMYLKDLIISILKDIYTHRQALKAGKHRSQYESQALVNSLTFGKDSLVEILVAHQISSRKEQVLFLQKVILELLENKNTKEVKEFHKRTDRGLRKK